MVVSRAVMGVFLTYSWSKTYWISLFDIYCGMVASELLGQVVAHYVGVWGCQIWVCLWIHLVLSVIGGAWTWHNDKLLPCFVLHLLNPGQLFLEMLTLFLFGFAWLRSEILVLIKGTGFGQIHYLSPCLWNVSIGVHTGIWIQVWLSWNCSVFIIMQRCLYPFHLLEVHVASQIVFRGILIVINFFISIIYHFLSGSLSVSTDINYVYYTVFNMWIPFRLVAVESTGFLYVGGGWKRAWIYLSGEVFVALIIVCGGSTLFTMKMSLKLTNSTMPWTIWSLYPVPLV